MKKIRRLLFSLALGLIVLAGCSTEETASFSLVEISSVRWEDEEPPVSYIVNQPEHPDQVVILRNEQISEVENSLSRDVYDLENATVTEEEIVIEYEGQTDTFERLSETVAKKEDNLQYQYHGPAE